MAMYVGSSGEN